MCEAEDDNSRPQRTPRKIVPPVAQHRQTEPNENDRQPRHKDHWVKPDHGHPISQRTCEKEKTLPGGRHNDEQKRDLQAGEHSEQFVREPGILLDQPVADQLVRKNKGGDSDELAEPSAGILGKFEIGRILDQLHPAEKIRHLHDDKTKEQQVHQP